MIKNTLIAVTATVMIGLSFTGCASTAENMKAQGYGPDYSQGYGDGCDSGKKSGGSMFDQFKKNVDRYDNNNKYREGWEDGYESCKSQEKELMHSIDDASRDQAIRDSSKYRY